ncbi:MAG TPA: glutamate-cysteine ligase family protein [Haliangium sp.]|nr:glutamate-cysteine ligase family protein [Haliangium sp.]
MSDGAPSGDGAPLRLFEAHGIEIEYIIVDAETLSVRPIADELLRAVGGGHEVEVEVDLGEISWSNELASHVVELKTSAPRPSLDGLGAAFQEHVGRVEDILGPLGARLMPTGMHPWMDPHRELVLWPHGKSDVIYRTFDRIFDCRGHGWANLQSMHVNLPFAGDDELGRLHAAVRLALPILPALAASSPVADGRLTGFHDFRMEVYRQNARRVPSVAGVLIPEAVFTRAEYQGRLLQRIYDDLAGLDPQGILRHEWVNARACIARFDRSALEIRLLDTQECPAADVAVAGAVTAVVRSLVEERHASQQAQRAWHEVRLSEILRAVIRDADQTVIDDAEYLALFGYPERGPCRAGELWQHLVESVVARDPGYPAWAGPLRNILQHGCLARRIAHALGRDAGPARLRHVYQRLADCLRQGALFAPDDE